MADEGLILAGDLYIDRKTPNGTLTGYYPELINVVKFELKHGGETQERMGRRRDTFGQAVGVVAQPKPTKLSIEFDSANDAQSMAMAMTGSVIAVDDAERDVIDVFTIALEQGKWIDLDGEKISDVVITSQDGLIVYEEGVHYAVNARMGFWQPLSIARNTPLKISYTVAPKKAKRIRAGDTPIIRCALKLDGENLETGDQIICTVPEAVFVSNAVINLFDTKFVTLSLDGTIRSLSGQSPYTYEIVENG
jgi:hypothetical protein